MLLSCHDGHMHAMYTTSDGGINSINNPDSLPVILQMVQGVRGMRSSLATTQSDLQELQDALLSTIASRQ